MLKELEYKGEWWLPDNPTDVLSGTLRFDSGQPILELIGTFKSSDAFQKGTVTDIILGSAGGENITLHQCLQTELHLNSSGKHLSLLSAVYAFFGVHFQTKEQIKFKGININFPHLTEWMGKLSNFDEQLGKGDFIIKYTRPKPVEAVLNNGAKLTISTGANLSISLSEMSLKEETWVSTETEEELALDKCLKTVYYLANFFSLATMKPIHPMVVEGKTEANRHGEYYSPVDICYNFINLAKPRKSLFPTDMLFSYADITDQVRIYLNNWFEKAELLEPVYSLYFGTLYNPRMYLHHRFLSQVQALESYHRRVMKNYEIPEEEHNKRLEEVFSTVSEKHKKWVKRKLKKYSNEPDLGNRLREILGKHPEIAGRFIGDGNSFIDTVVATRNYLTHYDQSLKQQAASGEELHHITRKLRLLMEACLLFELGFSVDQINTFFFRNRRYQRELRQAS